MQLYLLEDGHGIGLLLLCVLLCCSPLHATTHHHLAVASHARPVLLLGAGNCGLDLFHHLRLLLGGLHLLEDLNGGRLLLRHCGSSRHVVSSRLATSSHVVHHLGPLVSCRSGSIDEGSILGHRALGEEGRIVGAPRCHASSLIHATTTTSQLLLLLLLPKEVGDVSPLGCLGPSLGSGSDSDVAGLVVLALLLLHKGLHQYMMMLRSVATARDNLRRELVEGASDRGRGKRGGAASYLGDCRH